MPRSRPRPSARARRDAPRQALGSDAAAVGRQPGRDIKEGLNMRYAETGYNLEIDLSRGSVERVATDPKLTELYLGGLGTNARLLWDRVPPEAEPFSPDNLLIFAAGLLCGTPATRS